MALMKAEPVPALQPVFLALLPGALVLTGWHGAGVLLTLIGVGAGTAIALLLLPSGTQSRWQRLRNQPGAWLAALLLGLALPPALPLWLGVAGGAVTVAARQSRIVAANPAMLAYALLLLAFPLAMSRWPLAGAAPAELQESLRAVLGLLPEQRLDALSGATALEQLRADTAHTVAELRAREPAFGAWGARGIEWANAAFLAGGLWLAWRGLVAWRLPAAMLGALFLLALFGNDGGSSASRGPALFHLFSGGTMLAAFFVLTEPRGAPRSALGQWLGGALAGLLAYAMRTGGAWPDGIAFAVLALNAVAPALDWPQPLLNAPQAGA
ncbi:MAG: RnfABCDGE type electron transport complex subunit D, partial [Gammaproteobacteria bacterium]